MKTHRITLLAAALFACAIADAQSQFPGRFGWGQPTPTTLQKATSETEAFGMSKFAGKPLRASNQEQLGTVSDFLIETQTGNIRYAVVPSGASERGETYRLVPVAALDPSSNNDALFVRINRDQWNRVGTLTEAELPGRVALTAEVQQRYAQQFGSAAPDSSASSDFTRASRWKGQTLHSGGDQLGSIDDVILDVRSRTAAALLKPTGGYAPAAQKFVVPFERLQLTGDSRAPISTTLTRNDFQAAQATLSPTGATGGPFGQGYPPSNAAANAVQQALSREPGILVGAGVQVVPESRLVLRGTAQNEGQRQAIENTARRAAPDMVIENQITVQGR